MPSRLFFGASPINVSTLNLLRVNNSETELLRKMHEPLKIGTALGQTWIKASCSAQNVFHTVDGAICIYLVFFCSVVSFGLHFILVIRYRSVLCVHRKTNTQLIGTQFLSDALCSACVQKGTCRRSRNPLYRLLMGCTLPATIKLHFISCGRDATAVNASSMFFFSSNRLSEMA